MSKDQLVIDERLIFSRFGSLTDKRDSLYFDFIEIDEKKEISDAWVKFSCNVVNDLLSVIDLTKSLYDRLVDGIQRAQKKPSMEELSRIKSLTEFWLDLTVMSYLYSTIEKRGLFGETGSKKVNQLGYIETKKSIDDLILLAFRAGNEFFTQNARITLGEVLFLSQEKRQLDLLDGLENGEELKIKSLGDYDQKQAHFLITKVRESLIESSNQWWWRDPIAMYSSSEHAIEHIKSMNLNWAQCTSDLITKGLAFTSTFYAPTQSFSNLSLAQHYYRLGIAALRKRATSNAADYFKQAVLLTNNIPFENIDLRQATEFWRTSTQNQVLIFEQMSVLGQISADYERMIDALKNNNMELVKQFLTSNMEKLDVILSSGDVAYISSVAVTYETVFSFLNGQIKTDFKLKETLEFIDSRMSTISERLHQATNQLSRTWIRIINKDPDNLDGLEEVVSNLAKPMLALFVLPPSNEKVIDTTNKILAITTATEALTIQQIADKEFGTNPVKEMLMRAKSYRLAQEAYSYVADIHDEEIIGLIKKLLKPMESSSLLRGLIAEIQLKSAVIQFKFINRIAPLIESSALANPEADRLQKIDEDELEGFEEEVELIHLAATTLVENQAPLTIRGMPLNWDIFVSVKLYTLALNQILKSVRHAINAIQSTSKEDSIEHWGEAKDLSQKTSDIMSQGRRKETKALAEQTFSLTQLYRNFENSVRDRKKIDQFPVEGIVSLIQELVMGI